MTRVFESWASSSLGIRTYLRYVEHCHLLSVWIMEFCTPLALAVVAVLMRKLWLANLELSTPALLRFFRNWATKSSLDSTEPSLNTK